MPKERPRALFIVGPTASGKSAVAEIIALETGAELISLDSVAVYRDMNVGSAKPRIVSRGGDVSVAESGVRYRLIDVVSPEEPWDMSKHVALAEKAFFENLSEGKRSVFVGGTALYLKSLAEGFFEGPPRSEEFRKSLRERFEREGVDSLMDELARVDPATFRKTARNNYKRLERALEVYSLTGKPISELQRQWGTSRDDFEAVFAGIRYPREELYRRIEQRVDDMLRAGLEFECARLLDKYANISESAKAAIGYREMFEHIRGAISLEDATALIKTRTRQFAKKQLTWFRHFKAAAWFPAPEYDDTRKLANAVEAYFESGILEPPAFVDDSFEPPESPTP
ncbi:MAG: tRNA (adenosine(37)-N6)-dimethylallyltransferase MiaA [Planctomycetes bacterium]|nr:tRNA (adenosine(37)-N6)-dimethylallyltransferase MiaA [Planctomycetota bacterium]